MGIFAMPSLGADMEAGTLVEWLVKPGDEVHRGDVVAVVETQKGAIEIECFQDGSVLELQADLGATLPVGAPLALILGPGETAPEPKEPKAPAVAAKPEVAPRPAVADKPEAVPGPAVAAPLPCGATPASPAARLRARELGIDLATVSGSGPAGAILLADLEAREPDAMRVQTTAPMAEMRRAIAAAMVRSKQTIPHFYLSQTIDIQSARAWLETRNADRLPSDRLLLGALFVRATALAAAKVPSVNGQCVDGTFHPSDRINTGIAVALRGGGLVAPALIDAGAMSVDETMAGLRDLVLRARAGRLRSSELTEGTITISSLGAVGAEAMAGVIFPPQVALVGLGAPKLRPWVVNGAVVPRTVVTLTLSVDHRVSDGRQAGRFIAEFQSHIASPETL
ncbi:dihydrolipoamide acetyltransferase family protein [Pseudophaeobacter flagellatus]|uniref:dihydrolipoamide acetyltransferase family protein n=1 Tax=Pseudophaeobacter flagellatus TaxID=2899119 RepID=UPI001E4CD658|nr:dihydrolipoamide acetyltransferase family protein [Pseudophaeobacter flagellatus]MCD9148765.1 2-oxo acid dehydrogenase subunit E2 [Pseudophaeobacter flagellatus]